MGWTLTYNETTKTFAEWGFSALQRRTTNRKADVVTFAAENVLFDEDPAFPFDSEIEIFNGETRWFSGRVRDVRRQGDGENEILIYEVVGVLSWLDELVFRQPWKYVSDFTNPQSSLVTEYLSNLVLFQKIVGNETQLATVREQVQEVFDWLTSQWTAAGVSPKFQLDASRIPEHQVPFEEAYNYTCAQVLNICLATLPDASVSVDYATTPPTVHIARRGDDASVAAAPNGFLEQVELTVPAEGEGDDSPITSVSIQARNDAKPPAVVLEFLQSHSVNGFTTRIVQQDVYPVGTDPKGFRIIPQTVVLEGHNLSYPQAVLSVRTIAQASADWWKLQDTSLSKANVRNLVIRDATRSGSLAYEILPDSDPWGPFCGGSCEEDLIEAFADYDRVESHGGGEKTVEKVRNQLLSVRIMTTDRESGTYQGPLSGSLAEPVPVGMAEAIFKSVAQTHYDGELVLEEDECSGLVRVGQVLNLINASRPEWATARMMVHEVAEEIDTGRTTIRVGPVQVLTVDDIMSWLRNFRRNNQGFWAARASGLNHTGGALRVATRSHKQSGSAGKESRERMVLLRRQGGAAGSGETAAQTTQAATAQIILDILDCMGVELKVREVKLCVDGVSWYFMALCSEKYSAPKTANPIGS